MQWFVLSPYVHTHLVILSLAPACWDEHQDKQGLACIGLHWCFSHPRPCPYEQCDRDVPTDLHWLIVPWTKNQEQSTFPLSPLYILWTKCVFEYVFMCVFHMICNAMSGCNVMSVMSDFVAEIILIISLTIRIQGVLKSFILSGKRKSTFNCQWFSLWFGCNTVSGILNRWLI